MRKLICLLTRRHYTLKNSHREYIAQELLEVGTKPIHWMAAGAIQMLSNTCAVCGKRL